MEQIPLAAKHYGGRHRQFVWAEESRHRLPEVALLAGSIQSFLAASLPAQPTGFWDRHPKPSPGRLCRALLSQIFPTPFPLPERVRKRARPQLISPKVRRLIRAKRLPSHLSATSGGQHPMARCSSRLADLLAVRVHRPLSGN